MRSLAPKSATLSLVLLATSCVTYTGVSKSSDGELYISGGTNYFVYSTPWVRRCKVLDTKLDCVELTESPKPAGSAGGATAPAPSSDSRASATPAPATAPESAPEKSKK